MEKISSIEKKTLQISNRDGTGYFGVTVYLTDKYADIIQVDKYIPIVELINFGFNLSEIETLKDDPKTKAIIFEENVIPCVEAKEIGIKWDFE